MSTKEVIMTAANFNPQFKFGRGFDHVNTACALAPLIFGCSPAFLAIGVINSAKGNNQQRFSIHNQILGLIFVGATFQQPVLLAIAAVVFVYLSCKAEGELTLSVYESALESLQNSFNIYFPVAKNWAAEKVAFCVDKIEVEFSKFSSGNSSNVTAPVVQTSEAPASEAIPEVVVEPTPTPVAPASVETSALPVSVQSPVTPVALTEAPANANARPPHRNKFADS
jgi:hypothetical protein